MDGIITLLANGHTVGKVAKVTGVCRATLEYWRQTDHEFRARWEDAIKDGADALEEEAIRRARDGTEKPVFYQGIVCGHIQEYSDQLLLRILEARKPNEFRRPSAINLTPADGDGTLEVRWKDNTPASDQETASTGDNTNQETTK